MTFPTLKLPKGTVCPNPACRTPSELGEFLGEVEMNPEGDGPPAIVGVCFVCATPHMVLRDGLVTLTQADFDLLPFKARGALKRIIRAVKAQKVRSARRPDTKN